MTDKVNIYEFPAGYSGRETYVRAVGRTGLVASCYVYRGDDDRYYVHPDFGGDYSGIGARSDMPMPMIMKPMGAYKSPVDGTMVTDRTAHRDHLKRHNLIEVGNEPIGKMTRPEPTKRTREIGERIKHHLDVVKAMPQRQYNEQVQAKVNTNV